MTPALLLLAADLLDKAASEFGNHGCNDYDLPRSMSHADVETLADLCNRDNFQNVRDMSKIDPKDMQTAKRLRRNAPDFVVMGALAFGLRELARRPA